jgi:hypothetical protein
MTTNNDDENAKSSPADQKTEDGKTTSTEQKPVAKE